MKIRVDRSAQRRRARRGMSAERDAWERALDMVANEHGNPYSTVLAETPIPTPILKDYQSKTVMRRLDPTIVRIFEGAMGMAPADLDEVFHTAATGITIEAPDEPDEGLQVGRWYEIGDTVLHEGTTYEVIQTFLYANSAWRPEHLQAHLVAQPEGQEWTPGAAFAVGDEVIYDGVWYVCRQAHTAQVGWEPPAVPALWELKQ